MNEDIIKETAKQLNLPYETVEKVMKAYFNFVRFRISKVPYKKLLSFDKIKTNFSLPGLGKLVVKNKANKLLHNNEREKGIESKVNV